MEGKAETEIDYRYMKMVTESLQEKEIDAGIWNQRRENTSFVSFGGRSISPEAGFLTGYVTSKKSGEDETEWYLHRLDYKSVCKFCRTYKTSLEALFYGCLALYLCRIKDCKKMVIGRSLLGRNKDTLSLIALEVDTLPFVIAPEPDITAENYLKELKTALTQQSLHGEDGGEMPEVVISYRPFRLLPVPEKGECREYNNGTVELPMKIFINDDRRDIELQVKYQKEVFSEEQIKKIIWKVIDFIVQIMENPQLRLSEIKLLTEAERQAVEACQPENRWKYTVSLLERFRQQKEKCKDKTAVIYRGKNYTYSDIYRMAYRIGNCMEAYADRKKDAIIGLCMERSPLLPAAMYGAWMKGFAFLPVSPGDSAERKTKIAKWCAAFITDDFVRKEMQQADDAEPRQFMIPPKSPAYYMFTSGTTGEPKLVMISHQSLCCRLEWMADTFCEDMDIIMQKTRNTFDVSIWELVLPFAFGKTMCILEDGMENRPEKIAAELSRSHVTMVHFVPSMFEAFLRYMRDRKNAFPDLKTIVFSGELLQPELVKGAAGLFPGVKVYNLYGPAECTIDVSFYRCSGTEERVPIGRPVYNTRLYVRNRWGDILPVGAVGELTVEGELVGLGYYRMEQGGYEEPVLSERRYRTGDLAVLSEDGMLYYKGRKDRQIKHRGMRINLDEIEENLRMPDVGIQSTMLYINDRVVAFYTGEMESAELRKSAAAVLPYYMVPAEFVRVESFPVSQHGKTDKEQLRKEYQESLSVACKKKQRFSADARVRKRQVKMLRLAKRQLRRNDITLDSNLFEKGMDSLAVLEFIAACADQGIRLHHGQIYESPYIGELACEGQAGVSGVVYLKKGNYKTLLLVVPFAGGSPLSCRKLAEELEDMEIDVAAVNVSAYAGQSVAAEAVSVCRKVLENPCRNIFILGSCVGSSLALALADRLKPYLKGLFLCEALPYEGVSVGRHIWTYWDIFSDKHLSYLLQMLRGKKYKMNKEQLHNFRSDVKKSAQYLAGRKRVNVNCPVVLVFGTGDMVTKNYRKDYREWRKWLPSSYKVYIIPGAKHFLLEDEPVKVGKIVREQIKTM